MQPSYSDISKMIDHTILAPTSTIEDLENGCRLGLAYDVASICIMPYYLKRCTELLAGSSIVPCCVIGFPHGSNVTSVKALEAEQALRDGGRELDMVVNISQVLSGKWDYVKRDIQAVLDVAHAAGAKLKVIFENCYLNDAQKIKLCEICSELGVDWVKTSTGYGTGGATLDDLRLMRKHTPASVAIKAAGGIRDYDTLLLAREIGVNRIGTSGTPKLLDECRRRLDLEPIQFAGQAKATNY